MGGKRITQAEFIRRARAIHGDRYDYSQTVFVKSALPVTIICRKHGPFSQIAYDHLHGHGCKRCGGDKALSWKRSNTEEFIRRAKIVHGDKYDYSEVEYINIDTRVKIICPVHGPFLQIPYDHLQGRGCKACGYDKVRKSLRSNTGEFIKQARAVHDDRYDYSQVEYVTTDTPVTIICPVHGPFRQSPHSHLAGCGCRKCGRDVCADKLRKNTEDFIRRAREVHADHYDYSLVEYVDIRTPVKIICPTHGAFLQTPDIHLRGHGCKLCYSDELSYIMRSHLRPQARVKRKTTEQFILEAKKVHGDLYDYSQVEYISDDEKVTIICKKHGLFSQKANNHLNGMGCPICRASKGELRILKWLKLSGIEFKKEAILRSPLAPGKRKFFKVDFLLEGNSPTIIEYNGPQHYANIEGWGGQEGYNYRLERDVKLKEYCEQENIRLIVIPYTDFDRIEEILDQEFLATKLRS